MTVSRPYHENQLPRSPLLTSIPPFSPASTLTGFHDPGRRFHSRRRDRRRVHLRAKIQGRKFQAQTYGATLSLSPFFLPGYPSYLHDVLFFMRYKDSLLFSSSFE